MSMLAHLKHARYWALRVNWRVGTCMLLWLVAPRVLPPATAATVRDAALAGMIAAILAWANENGQRGRLAARHGGLLGARRDDDDTKGA